VSRDQGLEGVAVRLHVSTFFKTLPITS